MIAPDPDEKTAGKIFSRTGDAMSPVAVGCDSKIIPGFDSSGGLRRALWRADAF
jgi:hypothetical protein